MNKNRSLKDMIYKEYLKAALVPILIIELMLLIMYFSMTGYSGSKTKDTLLDSAQKELTEISQREARNINQEISKISDFSGILQKENTNVFIKPQTHVLPNGMPQFSVAANGVYYKNKDNGGSSVFYSNITKISDKEKQKAIITETFDPLYKSVLEANPNIVGIYFNSYDSMCRYYPFLPNVYNVFSADMNIPNFNFYYLADQKHNPEKKVIWTDTYLDPAGMGWMASCIAPIYNNGYLEGVTGIDVTIDKIVKNILNMELPWDAGAFLVDKNGVIIAMPEKIETILNLKELRQQVYESHVLKDTLKPEEFNLLSNKNPQIAAQFKEIINSKEKIHTVKIADKEYFVAQEKIDETGWHLMMLVDKEIVFEPVFKLDKLSKQTGLIAFIFMLAFYLVFFSFLMVKSKKVAKKIATPIIEIAEMTSGVKENLKSRRIEKEDTDIEEIDLLIKNFNSMTAELSNFYIELEEKVSNRTQELFALNQELMALYDESNDTNKKLESAYLELKNAQQKVTQQEKMASIGQLAAGVAHEINNPMGYIISNINTLKKYTESIASFIKAVEESMKETVEGEQNQESKESFSKCFMKIAEMKKVLKVDYMLDDLKDLLTETLEGTDRVKNIVQDLKIFSRVSTETEMSDINSGINSVINILWNEIKYKANIKKDFGEIPLTKCNLGQLNQVFMNLILNAVQAIEVRGEILISTAEKEGNIVISVIDTGSGIPEDVMKRVFEPFFTTKAVGSGTGLGLSVSYDIIKKHNGTIDVESIVGQGTTFTVKIPIITD